MDKYIYEAEVLEVYDADTITLLVDVGFSIYIKEKCRFLNIDTPEIRTRNKKEKKLGLEARDFVRDRILGEFINIKTIKKGRGKFGRYLIEVFLKDGSSLNKLLIKKGYAKEYDGGKREKWFAGE